MSEEKRNLVYRVVRVAIVLWVGLMLFQCDGCNGTKEPESTDTPEPDVAVGVDYEVRRERAEVRAHVVGASANLTEFELATLTNSNWREMLDYGRVATNGVGRAELRADCAQVSGAPVCNCEAVILYQGSNLVSRPCHPEESAGTCATGQALLANCDICFETLSSRTCPEGTWVSITYLGQSEITIVTVGEGVAKVTPVTVLEYVETAPLEFEFETRIWSVKPIVLEAESVRSESGEATLPVFLYTAPDAKLEVIQAYADEMAIELPPSGVPLPVDELPRLVDPEFGLPRVLAALEWEQPYLPLWMYDLSKSAYEHGDILFPPSEPPYPDLGLILDFDGDQLADPRVQEAFVYAIDKGYVIAAAFPEEEVPGFHAIIDAVPVDAFTFPYDPEAGYALLDEAAYDRDLVVFVLFPQEDDPVAYAAKLIAGALSEIGIKLELVPVPGEEMDMLRQEYAYAELPVIAVLMLRPSSCTVEAEGEFAALWQYDDARLGCPLTSAPTVIQDAEQPFENGHMFWRADTRDIYVVYEEGPRTGSYDLFTDVWEEGDPEYSCIAEAEIPPGMLQPKRGFGLVWCELGGSDAAIGWGLEEEEGYYAGKGDPLIQDFENGVIFRDSAGMESGMAYVLFSDVRTFKHVSY